jgi:hypothetical protein
MKYLSTYIGDSTVLEIPLVWQGFEFVPGENWTLIFSAKFRSTDADVDSVFQKASGAGITVNYNLAQVELVPDDTLNLAEISLFYDIQAQNVTTGAIRTVALGRLNLTRDITRERTTSVPTTTTQPPLPFARTAPETHAAESKANPADDDELPLSDSAASWSIKKLTWANIKATLKIYFDTLYGKLYPEAPIHGSTYGIVPGVSTGGTPAANATALAAALTASSTLRRPLLLRDTIYINGQVIVTGTGIKLCGHGATIIQQSTAWHGLEINETTNAAYGLTIEGVRIEGQGSATHDKAALYGRKGDLSYLMSDLTLRDCFFTAFRTGCDLAGIAKYRTENLSVTACRVDQRWNHMQTVLMTNTRLVQGDSHADSACFEINGGNFFAGKVLGGEFGGSGKARFANITSGMLHVEAANLEAFTSAQVINKAGTGAMYLTMHNCRIAKAFGSSAEAFVSCEVSGGTGVPIVNISNIYGWSGSMRMLEIWGAHAAGPGVLNLGQAPILTSFAATQGGAIERSVSVQPGFREYSLTTSFAGTGTVYPGDIIHYAHYGNVGTDAWLTGPLVRVRDNNLGTDHYKAIVNDMLMRVLGVSARTASGNNVETDIQNVTLPIGVLRNVGESIDIDLFGNTAANANNKHFRFYFGGSLYLDFGALPINAESWTIKIRIQRGAFSGGTGYMKLVGTLDYGSGRVIKTAETPSAVIDSTATIATRVTVLTPTAASDAISLAAKTVWHRAPSAF